MTRTPPKPQHRIVRPLVFFNPPRDYTRLLPIFYHRDALANELIFGALAERGRTLGEPILTMPPVPSDLKQGEDWCYDQQEPLGPEHEVLCTTRPPLDDLGEPKQVMRGYNPIEEDARTAAREVFKHLSRSQEILQPHVAAALRHDYELWSNVEFYQRTGGHVQQFVTAPKKERKVKQSPGFLTACFLIRAPNFTAGGATLLNVFAMDGSAALVWAYLVSRLRTDWLFEDGFRMVVISGPKLPVHTTGLSFARRYEVKELVHVAL